MRLTYSILISLLLVAFLGCKAEETNIDTAPTLPAPSADTVALTAPAPTTQPETATTATTATTVTTVTTVTTAGEQPAAAAASKLPKNHTVDQGGVMHAAGATDNPTKKCGACHGKDLKGGKIAPSCFECHDQMWE